ncbi:MULTISPECIES: response regulator [Oerskovia]|uniref:Response regulator transcription factor n=2 Tax=Oerskovia TaxID=162491 RepID=A0ABR8V5E9_9CELL|nr:MULTISPECIES: response regulator transcription factor [Oerskovia]MBD7950479.1 response regulator transcription factor [Oerskovia rustica]MBD7999872.1 response regulator transcription factor [Oerskovia gallyi]
MTSTADRPSSSPTRPRTTVSATGTGAPSSAPTVRVLVVDDHPVVRSGLVGMLMAEPDLVVVGEAGDGREGVTLAHELGPDVVLMDLRMPVLDGVGATTEILASSAAGARRPRVVVLTTYETDTDILRAVEAGATGYLLKDTPRETLVAGIRAAARGETVLAPTVATRLVTTVRGAGERLTAREAQVLALVARGLSNPAIGRELFISEATVKTHLLRAFAKLGVDDRTRAVTVAIERGILPGA